ncbi:uncharacterized protein LOC135500501 [Lineus longissimus]|uniref:uncharacterized protein LOC135500501 n=1 Tax=Lineus longissimus TaxID=88925 RepID=UPI002B4F32F5
MLKFLALALVVLGPVAEGYGNFGPPPEDPSNTCKVSKTWMTQIKALRKHKEFKLGHGFNLSSIKLPQTWKLSPEVIKANGIVKCTAKGWNVDPHHVLVVPAHSHGVWCKIPKVWGMGKRTKLHAGLSLRIKCPTGLEHNADLKKDNGALKCDKGNWNVPDHSALCVKPSANANPMNFNFY